MLYQALLSFMNNPPLVSIIMNCYNGERYLRKAIDSIYSQTYKNWELIFWDNNSTDNSAAIARSYSEEKLRYFRSEETVVLGKARAYATKKAKGKYIAFLDVDDAWTRDKLEKQLQIFSEKNDIGLVYGRTKVIFKGKHNKDFVMYKGSSLPEGDVFSELAVENFIVFSSAMVDREKFNKCGGFPSSFLNSLDYWIFMHMAKIYKFGAVQEVCCEYLVHQDNLSFKQNIIGAKEAMTVLNEFPLDQEMVIAIEKQYSNLAIMYLKDYELFSFIKVMIKNKCFIMTVKRLALKVKNIF